MENALSPAELGTAILGLAVLCGFFVYRLFLWVCDAAVTPDPWNADIEKQIRESDAVELCHKCFAPQPPNQWFCEHCGTSVGDYNCVMPFVSYFSTGEVLRNGLLDRLRPSLFMIIGYVFIFPGLCLAFCTPLILTTPFYWMSVFSNMFRNRNEETQTDEMPVNPS